MACRNAVRAIAVKTAWLQRTVTGVPERTVRIGPSSSRPSAAATDAAAAASRVVLTMRQAGCSVLILRASARLARSGSHPEPQRAFLDANPLQQQRAERNERDGPGIQSASEERKARQLPCHSRVIRVS